MSQYDTEVDLENTNNSQTQAVEFVGRDRDVLDVGCWKGDLGRALATRGCRVSGVDVDEAAATVAREHLREVVVTDLDRSRLSEHFAPASFDVIVFADVLEHLMDPTAVLADARTLLRPGGFVVLSIPNITHGSVRLALLQGLWDYTEAGHLDRTHIRFFSRSGLVDLVRDAGFAIDELRGTVVDVLSREVHYDPDALPPAILEWVRDQQDAMTFQFLVRAHPDEHALTAPVPTLVPVVPLRSLRPVDRYTDQADAELAKSHLLLTQRDHVLGLEAAAAAARAKVTQVEAAKQVMRDRLASKNERLSTLRQQLRRAEQRIRRLESGPPSAPDGTWRKVRRAVGTRVRAQRG